MAITLANTQAVLASLSVLLGIAFHVSAFFAYLAIFGVNVQHLVISLSSMTLALTFVFGHSLQVRFRLANFGVCGQITRTCMQVQAYSYVLDLMEARVTRKQQFCTLCENGASDARYMPKGCSACHVTVRVHRQIYLTLRHSQTSCTCSRLLQVVYESVVFLFVVRPYQARAPSCKSSTVCVPQTLRNHNAASWSS